ncbi:MAG: hypothetical protein V4793_45155, partial [Paraburkholderia tropica]
RKRVDPKARRLVGQNGVLARSRGSRTDNGRRDGRCALLCVAALLNLLLLFGIRASGGIRRDLRVDGKRDENRKRHGKKLTLIFHLHFFNFREQS